MVTFLIITSALLGLFAIAIYFWQKPANRKETIDLPPATGPRTLFSGTFVGELAETSTTNSEVHADLVSRASRGDLDALLVAPDNELYEEVLNVAVGQASSPAKVLSLASFIAKHNLRVNRKLAEAMILSWQASPDRQTTAKMLHFAALSNDADAYRNAVELSLNYWREGKISGLSPTELQALFNSEFWLLSSEVRSSGTGFVLKRTLSSARRELEGTTNN